jgi:hypothetical protein
MQLTGLPTQDAGAEEIAQAERSDGGGDERTDFSGEGFETAQRQIARELGSSLGDSHGGRDLGPDKKLLLSDDNYSVCGFAGDRGC